MKLFKNLFIFIVLLSAIGCSNMQYSTRSQAETIVAGQKDFKEFIQYIALETDALGLAFDPIMKDGYPAIKPFSLIHQIFYLNKDGLLCCAFLDDKPRIVLIVPRTVLTITK